MNIQIKCYLYKNSSAISSVTLGQPSEIRRFGISAERYVNLYKRICEKIRVAYGSLINPNDEIKTYWIDEENDLVCFSTDEEANFAMEMQTAISTSKNMSSSPLFKIYVGINRANEPSASSEEPQIHPGVVCDGCNGSIIGTRNRCTVCPDFDLCSACKNKDVHKEHEFIVFNKPVRQRCPYGRQRRFFGNFNKNCHNQRPSTSNTNTAQNPFSNFFPFISNAVPMVNDPETLSKFGEHLKTFLDPFGIDVSYYIDSNQNKQSNEQKKTDKEEKKCEEKAPAEEPQTLSFQNISQNENETLIDLSKDDQKVKLERCLSNDSLPTLSYEKLSTQTDTANTLESAANSLKDALDNHNLAGYPKMSSIEKEEEEKKKSETIQDAEENGFNVVDIEKEMKYIKCVEQLTNMGYTDEAGWLSRLVIAKDGNINNVLDALQPSK
ncbi:sequestosome-1 isoform X1 [Brachionus plicatilis]|uniref:Sequestosome-1 isoform X1 n=1 Tax=Brachionus plicatilis TaxID=10195 RepID=A0A3M7SUY9_BRAPC|nr:sequestosome-1 isoform X1 [Brachionus plicatilis]